MLVRLVARVALMLALALPCHGALAHGALQRATPKAGSVVKTAPVRISLRFNEKLEPKFSTIAVTAANGERVEAGPAEVTAGSTLEVPLKPLAAGTYTVSWHVVSVDTHTTSGKYTFEVRP